jgi:hypothetical protein
MDAEYLIDRGVKLIGSLVLVLAIVYVLTFIGIVKCGDIPFWCDVYETIGGAPRVLIVYGNEGLGNPEELRLTLQDPSIVGANAVDIAHIDTISLGNLKNYKLVIVQKARQLSIDELNMFIDYVKTPEISGRLVWVGDAGTVKSQGELEGLMDTNGSVELLDNPWARAKETDSSYVLLNFDEFLGLRYLGNYCELNTCGEEMSVGTLKSELTGDHPLIYGTSPALEMRIVQERDFAVVRQFPNARNSNIVLSLDQGSVKVIDGQEFPRFIPVIATSGVGERVAYYSYPVEYFAKDNNYTLYIKNMYYGMLGK